MTVLCTYLTAKNIFRYVRKTYDIFEDYKDPRMSAMTFLCDFARTRKDALPLIMPALSQMLQEHAALPVAQQQTLAYAAKKGEWFIF